MRHVFRSGLPWAPMVLAVMFAVTIEAWSQEVVPTNVFLVDPNATPGPRVYTTIQGAIDAAVSLSRTTNQRAAVWVKQGVYNETLSIPADADLYVRGLPANRPWEVIVDGGGVSGGGAVLTIHTSNSLTPAFRYNPSADPDTNLSRLLIEGLTFRNGQYGIWIQGTGAAIPSYQNSSPTDPPVRPTISRCIILGSNPNGTQVSQAGVMIQDNAAPLLVNCSIGGYQKQQASERYNSLVGVHVRPPANPAADFFTDMLFCTVVMNENYGVYIENGATRTNQAANARVRNTVVYRNGDGLDAPAPGFTAPEGGLVWESDLFISPNQAPYNVPSPPDPSAVRVTLRGYGLVSDIDNPIGTRVYFGPMGDVPTRTDGTETVPVTLWHATPSTLLFTGTVDGEQTLSAYLPPSYLGAPGPVDVHILREDGFEMVVRNAFTYVEGTVPASTDPPEVTQVLPEWGPTTPTSKQNQIDPTERRGNWVFVYGARFEKECEVWWDTNGVAGLQTVGSTKDSQSERVIWLSSSKLYAKVPEWPTPTNGKIDVFVRNLGSGLNDGGGRLKEYEYRAAPELPRPSIAQVTPNFYRDLDGSVAAGAGREVTVDIIGWNFGPSMLEIPPGSGQWYPMPVIVKIGGIVCPYREIKRESSPPAPLRSAENSDNGIWQGENDVNGDSFDEIRDVRVPVAEFGAGGSYDVEVINYDGQRDVLPNAFTYYADTAPRIDRSTDFVWRPANFARLDSGGADSERTLLARGLDAGLLIAYAANGVYSNNDIAGRITNGNGVLPDELQRQHASHTQRIVKFRMPGSPSRQEPADETSALFRQRFADAVRLVDVYIANVRSAQGVYLPLSLGRPRIETQFAWAQDKDPPDSGEARYFEITAVRRRPAGDPYFAEADLTYWTNNMRLFVEGDEVVAADRVVSGNTVSFRLPDANNNGVPDLRDRGFVGPADVTVVLPKNTENNPLNTDLYWVAEDALWIPRVDANSDVVPPRAYAVTPRTIPDTGGVRVRVSGADFIGPYPPSANGTYTRISIRTQSNVWVPLISPTDTTTDPALDAFLDSIDAQKPYPIGVNKYQVVSPTEISFEFVDLTTHAVFSNTTAFPRNKALDVRVEHVDENGVVLTDSNGTPLTFVLPAALVLMDSSPPEVTRVYRVDLQGYFDPPTNSQPFPDQRWGEVLGGDLVAIEGNHFQPGTAPPRVRFGGAEARVLPPGPFVHRNGTTYTVPGNPDTALYVLTPPAPQGLPGTVDVTVISQRIIGGNTWLQEGRAPDDQRFVYVMDGAPVITEIQPNHVNREDTVSTVQNPKDATYFTIRGFNFDDVVGVEFDIDGDDTPETFGNEFFSISPFEIAVVAPAWNGDQPRQGLGLTDADFDGRYGGVNGVVRIAAVRVVNRVEFGEPVRVKSNNGGPIYYYDPDRYDRPIKPRVPILEFNDVFINYRDYVNVKPGQGSISVDPLLDPGPVTIHTPGPRMIVAAPQNWWLGKLAVRSDTFDNPVRDKAGKIELSPFTSEDLELDNRPNGPDRNIHGTGPVNQALSEIGADELPYGPDRLEWYYAEVLPNPVGKLPKESLTIEVRFRGLRASLMSSGDFPPPDQRVFIVPQGGEPQSPDHRIPLKFVQELGGWSYILTNTDAINTVVFRQGGPPPGPDTLPQWGDILADGHATICVDMPAGVSGIGRLLLGDDPVDLTDGDVIVEQAINGRHFLIDTVPPRIQIEAYPDEQILPWNLVPYQAENGATHNDEYFPNSNNVAPGTHPFPLPPAYMFGQYYSPADTSNPLNRAPVEYNGVIINPFRVGGTLTPGPSKAQILFNVGSLSNGLPREDLDMDIVVRFVDPHVTVLSAAPYSDPANLIMAGRQSGSFADQPNEDRFTSADTREVSGFKPYAFSDTRNLNALEFGEAHWIFDEGRTVFQAAATNLASFSGQFTPEQDSTSVTAAVAPSVTVTSNYKRNEGFRRDDPTATTYHDNNVLVARWDLSDLDWDAVRRSYETDKPFHLAIRFRAQDQAGNIAERELLLDPLHIWWLLKMQTKIEVGVGEAAQTNRPNFRWGPDRAYDPGTYFGPKPGYMYRIYATAMTPPEQNQYDGVYRPVTGWSPWSTNRQLGPDDFYYPLRAAGWDPDNQEFWVLLVVLGCDEAGNVEPWPSDIFDPPDQPIDFTVSGELGANRRARALQLPNWRRFLWSGVPKPDTFVTPTYWYGDLDGNLSVNDGDINLGANPYIVMPPANSNRPNVEASFLLEAKYIGPGAERLKIVWELLEENVRIRSGIALSGDTIVPTPGPFPRTLGDYPPPPKKILHYVFRASAFVDDNNNGQYDVGERSDPTWANVSFVVTPYPVDPKRDYDKQPIKSMEEM